MNTKNKSQHENELSHPMVHYLLTIHKLKEKKGYARATDIAKDLSLTKGTVSTMLNNLKRKGFIQEEEDSKFVLLTHDGHDEVHRILSSRTLLFYFLRDFVGVDAKTAEEDSCQMEHLLSATSNQKFFEFMKKLSSGKKIEPMSTELKLAEFDSVEEFLEQQKGDTFLK